MILIQADRRRDGLVGLTAAGRAEIAERIDRARAAKARGLDGFGVIAAVEGIEADGVPRKPCRRCGTPLPATPEYFYRQAAGRDGLREKCRTCMGAARRGRRRGRPVDAATLRDRGRRRRERLKAEIGYTKPPRARLVDTLGDARRRLARQGDPRRRARTEATIRRLEAAIAELDGTTAA